MSHIKPHQYAVGFILYHQGVFWDSWLQEDCCCPGTAGECGMLIAWRCMMPIAGGIQLQGWCWSAQGRGTCDIGAPVVPEHPLQVLLLYGGSVWSWGQMPCGFRSWDRRSGTARSSASSAGEKALPVFLVSGCSQCLLGTLHWGWVMVPVSRPG